MKKLIAFLSAFWVIASCSAAPLNAQLWQQGNAFYAQKNYDSAVMCFEQLAAVKPANAAVYYNLGNAYYRLHRIGPAVLNYERALKRAPEYKDAQDNLLLAQSTIPNHIQPTRDIFFVRWWTALSNPLYARSWAVVSLLFFLLLLGLLLYRRINRAGAVWLRPQMTGAVAVLWLVALFLSFQAARGVAGPAQSVMLVQDAPLLPRPDASAKPEGLIPEGTVVRTGELKGAWIAITLPDGRSGWSGSADLQRVD